MVFSSTDRIVRVDHLQRHLNALRLDEIPEGEQGLGEYVEDEARHLPTAQFAYLDKELFARVTTYSKSTEPLDKKAAIAAIDQLIDAKLPVENPSKISQMVESIRTVMSTCNDPKLLEKAADVMGKLVSAGGNLTAEVVNSEVKEALVQLAKPAHHISELRRLSACHMLRTLADNAPSVFNVHVLPFMERIWNALRDNRMGVREVAVGALRSCLKLVEKRETRYRVQWWYRLFDQTMVGLERPLNVRPQEMEVYVHASLLALGELLEHSGEFMLARYKQTVDTVLYLRDSKHMNVKMQVMLLIPKMSSFAPEKFVVAYLHTCTQHLLNVMTREQPSLAIAAFTSFGQMLTPLAAPQSVTDLRTKMQQYLPDIEAQILEACSPKHQNAKQDHARRAMVLEAMSCAATLAEALGPMWEEGVARLIKPMILTGLSVGLIQALMKISKHLPNTVPTVQQHLLLPVLVALPMPTSDSTLVHTSQRQREGSSWRHCYHVKAGLLRSSGMEDFARQVQSQVSSHLEEDGRQKKMVKVALDTLAEVDFGQHMLLGFTQDVLLSYACSEDEQVRKSAALAAWKVTERQWSVLRKLVYDGQGGRTESLQMCHFAVEHIVKQLLTMAAADMDPAVRRAIVERFLPAFLDDGGPDAGPDEEGLLMFFAQAESANALTLCLNDTNAHVRLASLTIMGKIARLNPAVSFPVLRRHLQQLLGDFSSSADSARLDETAVLLSAMIEQCPELVMPNLHTVQDKLANKLDQARARIKEHGGKSKSGHSMTDSIMQVISSLVSKATVLYRPFLPHVLESVIEAITDRWNDAKHLPAAVSCLGNITGCTGYVIEPYINHPPLLPAMLELLDQTYPSTLHIQVVKVLGIIGALGPHTHKLIQAAATGEGKLEKDGVSGISEDDKKDDERTLVRFEPIPTQNLSHSEDFYPSTAINALLKQLCDMKMAPQHQDVITALMYIFKDLKLGSVTYLSVTMPVLLSVVRHSEETLQAFVVREIIDLVRIVQAHMRPYLQELLDLIVDFWDMEKPVLLKLMLNLLARLAVILQEDMRQHAGRLVPRFVHIFQEAARSGDYHATEPALQALEALGQSLETQFHTLLPALVRLLPAVNSSITPKETKRSILATMSNLLPRMRLAPHASTILHPLICTIRNSKIPEVRVDAINTICNVSVAIGSSLSLFVPTIQSVISQANLPAPERWQRIMRTLAKNEAPCIADMTTRWDDASGWAAEMDSVRYRTPLCAPPENPPTALNPRVSQENLRKAWESSHRCTKEDWTEWLRRLSVELLAHSSSPALRSCHQLARVQPTMARELFSVGFVSCWLEIDETSQRELVRSLEAALVSPSIPPEIVTALLNLAEFMEHNERPLPLDTRTLGALAEKCHAYAKALHYKELEYMTSPMTAVESLVHICNQLRLPDAASGILRYTMAQVPGTHAADWYEKLSMFEEALDSYKEQLEACERGSQSYWENLLGSMRCMSAIGDWDNLLRTCQNEWFRVDILKRQEMSTMAAHAAWHMSQWRQMGRYVDSMDATQMRENTSSESSLLRAVLAINRNKNSEDFGPAITHIERTRELLSVELAALVGESYSRAYQDIVRAQQCTELMEVVEYTKAQNVVMRLSGRGNGSDSDSKVDDEVRRATEKMQLVREVWRTRLMGVERSVDVWTQLLAVRKLVVPPREDADIYTKYAVMCRKENRASHGWRTLVQLLGYDPTTVPKGQRGYGSNSGNPMVMLYCLKHLWVQKSMPAHEVIDRMTELLEELKESHDSANLVCTFHLPRFTLVSQHIQKTLPVNSNKSGSMNMQQPAWQIADDSGSPVASRMPSSVPGVPNKIVSLQSLVPPNKPSLIAKAYFCKAQWTFVTNKEFSTELTDEINSAFQAATEHAPSWGKLWHKYGIFNMLVLRDWLGGVYASRRPPEECTHIIASAVKAFFKSVDMCGSGNRHETLQDVLRLLTLWYRYGNFEDVKVELNTGFKTVAVDTWLVAIPQMMARIHVDDGYIIDSLKELLVKIGRNHPQALMHPLLVATRSANTARQSNAQAVLNEIISHSPNLVRQTQTVSEELIRIAILWHEQWHEALEEASRLYFGEQDVEGMLHTLMPLHTKLNASMLNSPAMETKSEKFFKMTYGPDLAEAFKWCTKYQESRRDADLHQAWDLYYHIFRRINKNLPTVLSLDLKNVSATLYSARDLELAVPGTYAAGEPVVSIQRFAQTLQVIQSKQRPRKLTVIGSNGCEYQFLLKGHEDLRQDERVMQLFGLVNNLLAEERNAADRDLSIARYAVIPLSPNSGLIGWVRNCDTMHALIREYRESRRIPLNAEHKIMQNVAPNYDQMMVIQKVEVFEDALDRTSGDDLHKVLWLKSRNSEMWLDRRTNYTRSTAVMSMAGYVLGLGDRHPSNLMLDRYSGKLVHIDFGDCFEASMTREKYPEKVPFRLTRMMTKAMEVCGTQGSFEKTCDITMAVLREEKVSVMAMLEAFVFDPLINWRLLQSRPAQATASHNPTAVGLQSTPSTTVDNASDSQATTQRTTTEHLSQFVAIAQAGAQAGVSKDLMDKAQDVMIRMLNKLEGKDFRSDKGSALKTLEQVQKLIQRATSNELLCQSYIGWCPFW